MNITKPVLPEKDLEHIENWLHKFSEDTEIFISLGLLKYKSFSVSDSVDQPLASWQWDQEGLKTLHNIFILEKELNLDQYKDVSITKLLLLLKCHQPSEYNAILSCNLRKTLKTSLKEKTKEVSLAIIIALLAAWLAPDGLAELVKVY